MSIINVVKVICILLSGCKPDKACLDVLYIPNTYSFGNFSFIVLVIN